MQLHDLIFEPFISHDEIQEKISLMAGEINNDYKDSEIHFICILNGAFMFLADLAKQINVPGYMHF